ncbi:TPA: GDP-L-fucose synthase [Campylobacter jejuni]|nr:GDP-L-fucose synthase [Campylobacter jejuni]
MFKNSKIYIAGHKGLVGGAITKILKNQGYTNLILKTKDELDLTNQKAVNEFFEREKPEFVFFCAAKMGGMMEQLERRADFLYLNLMMQTNILHCAYRNKIKKLLYLSSLCIYPKNVSLPIQENSMLQGELQYINEPYAIAKIAGNKMCEFYNKQYDTTYITLVPTSIYGPRDNFNIKTTHVFPAILMKIYLGKLFYEKNYDRLISLLKLKTLKEVKEYLQKFGIDEQKITLLGSGKPRREFIFVDDVANACIFSMQNIDNNILKQYDENYHNCHLNLSSDENYSLLEIAMLIKDIAKYKGEIIFDQKSPDGTMLKKTNCDRLKKLGFKSQFSLVEGIKITYEWLDSTNDLRF